MIFPAVVEESDPAINRFSNELRSLLLVFGVAHVMASEPEGRYSGAGFSERPRGDIIFHFLLGHCEVL
jgi:hypothetical protein